MKYYNIDYKEVLKKVNSNIDGLTEEEAKERLKRDGANKLKEEKKESLVLKFLKEFNDLMIIILFIAAIISFVVSYINKESYIDSIIIIAIVILNALLGFLQELKADKAIDALKKMQVTKVKVKRDSTIQVINSEDVVKGDILVLEAGDTIVADARIISLASLKVDEASLTGESVPVSKIVDKLDGDKTISERLNMIYAGTNVVYGKCNAVVVETGMNTEFGAIAKSLNKEEKEITPLEKKINGISKALSIIIAVIILIMFIMGLVEKRSFLDVLMLSISLAVAAIPEGLPAVITITLSLGIGALAKKNAIVRKMASVETLGCTEIICSDKTGTITQNKMKVQEVVYDNKIIKVEDIDKDNIILKIMCLDNDAVKNNLEYVGDPTEIALYEVCEECLNIIKLRENNKRIDELPFDSERKMMSTINEENNKIRIYTKGSFDSLIKHCSYILENNKVIKLTKDKIKKLKEIETEESLKAYRILAYAYKDLDNNYKLDSELENNLIFVGLTCMIDPPREDVKASIKECLNAHIKPIMITGDSLSTAKAIAKDIGILKNDNEAILGEELDLMSEKELKKKVSNYSVYARVSPINKLSIVKAWIQNGKVVAMTGDGVNDAPALKAANIGVGMGITGTEVSKSVSDIVLADDSFSTIVSAIKEGRRIFDNIRNVLVYLLSCNIAEVLIVFLGMMFGVEIFLPIQLLYINLITDSIPAIALAFEKEDSDIMNREIRKKDSSFFTPFLISKLTVTSILKAISILLIYFINLKLYNQDVAISMAFLTLILLEMVFAYSCRNIKKTVLNNKFLDNKFMNRSILCLLVIQIMLFVSPLKNIFNIVDLSLVQVTYVIFIVLLIFLIDEFSKGILSKIFKD